MVIQYKIDSIKISKEFLFLKVDGIDFQYKISEISKTLLNAKEDELNNFEVTPSGYGIYWPLLDEDISISALLNLSQK
ncbi:MAG: hypothetical protein A2033_09030 [Bacteroidetes bacterium GWA2_31_9]|nr:MAG: hypothetical protein A2033_09030 [Bacteroidetes bacterium GWA2_31_9]